MSILLKLHLSLQNRRLNMALRKGDVSALVSLADDSSLRPKREQTLSAVRLLLDGGRLRAASALLQNALKAEPGQSTLLAALAEVDQKIVSTPVPSQAAHLAHRADAERDAGRISSAAALYQQALLIAPDAVHWRVQRANMLKDSGELAAAELEYRRAQLELPDDADVPIQLGRALKVAGRSVEARESFREALRREPNNRVARDELAWLGEPQDHIRQTIAALEHGEPFALFALADALADLKQSFSRIERLLPSASAGFAFPPELHDLFRRQCPLPAAPASLAPFKLAILFDADAGTDTSFHARLDALIALADHRITLIATVTNISRRIEIQRRAAPEVGKELLWCASPTLSTLAALLTQHRCHGLLLLDGEAICDAVAPSWFTLALSHTDVAYSDGESGRLGHSGHIERHMPVLRSCRDSYSSGDLGRAVAVRSEVVMEIATAWPLHSSTVATLSSFIMGRAKALHIPLFLTCDLGDAPSPQARSTPLVSRSEVPIAIGCVIPTRDYPDDAERFVRSLLSTARHPQALSIIVVDNGVLGEGLDALKRLESEGVKIINYQEDFNWSRINNIAASELNEAKILLFANDDMEMITQHWDSEMRGALELGGVVGAKLLYPDMTIQHAGILCCWNGRPEHEGRGEPADATGPANRWQRRRTAMAVTGAFLATTRADFETLGGFDPDFPFGYNDVDFCLRLRELGRDTVYTPHITLIHHESKTRGRYALDPAKAARAAAEDARFFERWPTHLTLDPTVNPNWSEAFAPFRAYRSPKSAEILRYLERQLATEARD